MNIWATMGLGFFVGTVSTHLFWISLNLSRRHRHQWKAISAYCDGLLHYMDGGEGQPYGMYVCTNVVSRCECGELRQQAMPGKHTLESLQGEDSEVQRVLKGLEKK